MNIKDFEIEEFEKELTVLINKYSFVDGSDTDFLLAEYLVNVIKSYNYGKKQKGGVNTKPTTPKIIYQETQKIASLIAIAGGFEPAPGVLFSSKMRSLRGREWFRLAMKIQEIAFNHKIDAVVEAMENPFKTTSGGLKCKI